MLKENKKEREINNILTGGPDGPGGPTTYINIEGLKILFILSIIKCFLKLKLFYFLL